MSFSQMGFSELRFTIQIWIEILLQITCRTKEIKKGYVYVYFNIKWLKITKNGGSLRLLWIDILLRALLCNFLLAMMRCLISPLKQGWDLCWSLKDIIGTYWPRQLRRRSLNLSTFSYTPIERFTMSQVISLLNAWASAYLLELRVTIVGDKALELSNGILLTPKNGRWSWHQESHLYTLTQDSTITSSNVDEESVTPVGERISWVAFSCGWGRRLFEAGRLVTFPSHMTGAYSRLGCFVPFYRGGEGGCLFYFLL